MLRSKSVGGVEPRLDKEARALAEGGYDVHAILWDRDLAFPEEETQDGYQVRRVRLKARYNHPSLAWKLPRWWSRAYGLLRQMRPDIVHAADYDSVPPALRARRAWGAKVVFDIWDFYADMMTARVPGFVRAALARREARAIRDADLVILPDMVGRQRMTVEPRRLIEIRNVPETRTIISERFNRFTVFYAGNISRDRGLLDILRACEDTGSTFLVAGQGPDERELLPAIESSPSGMFLGYLSQDKVLSHTAGADVIPLLYDPSVPINRIASPNKLYEAMMMGKPVIVSEGTAMAELVQSAELGIVVPYGDFPALRDALERLMLSPGLMEEMGHRGQALFESKYRWDIMKRRLLDAYEKLS